MIETVCHSCLYCDVMEDQTTKCYCDITPFTSDFCQKWISKNEVFYEVGGVVTDLDLKRQVAMFIQHAKM